VSAMAGSPRSLRLRTYQVGFGDCFLLSVFYDDGDDRHVLIDFGTTSLPPDCADDHMVRVAEDIRAATGEKLTAVVVTHRHKDHMGGFAVQADGQGSGDIIRSLRPDLVVQPWTEDPDAPTGSRGPDGARTPDNAFAAALDHMHDLAAIAVREAEQGGGLGFRGSRELAFLGKDNIKNRSAVENLIAMGQAGRAEYLHYGKPSALEELLPGVKVRVLGPPTLDQAPEIRRQRSKDDEEFWQLQAAAWGAGTADVGGQPLFPGAPLIEGDPLHTRWFVSRLEQARGQQLLSIVRELDRAMNNTSLILLFTIGKLRLLFPGDAQIESWLYALEQAPDAADNLAELGRVDVYKVGHHGSRNATPKSLWARLFDGEEARGPASGRPLFTVCSTLAGEHGHTESGTEVPRSTLVTEMKARSEYFTTESLAERGKLFEDLNRQVADGVAAGEPGR
jgi:Metallo-beta-lactamase superfamily